MSNNKSLLSFFNLSKERHVVATRTLLSSSNNVTGSFYTFVYVSMWVFVSFQRLPTFPQTATCLTSSHTTNGHRNEPKQRPEVVAWRRLMQLRAGAQMPLSIGKSQARAFLFVVVGVEKAGCLNLAWVYSRPIASCFRSYRELAKFRRYPKTKLTRRQAIETVL